MNITNGGEYICTAKNEYGMAKILFNLNVLCKDFSTPKSQFIQSFVFSVLTNVFFFFILAEPHLTSGFEKLNSKLSPDNKSAQLGSKLTLICPYENFDSIEWFKNSGRVDIQTQYMAFSSVSAAQQGKILIIIFINFSSIR